MMIALRSDLIQCGIAIVAPTLALIGFQAWSLSGGPTSAIAAPSAVENVPGVKRIELAPMTADELAAAGRALELGNDVASDPFLRKVARLELVNLTQIQIPIENEPQIEPVPSVMVTAVVAGRQPIAVVDGQPRMVGDRVGTGWRIVEVRTQGIIIEHADGRRAALNIQRARP